MLGPMVSYLIDDFPEAQRLFGRETCVAAARDFDMEAIAKQYAPELWGHESHEAAQVPA